MSRTAIDAQGSWFEPEEIDHLRTLLPMLYVDIVPVRTDTDGTLTEVGLLLRASGDGRIVRSIVSGRVLVHESLREAIDRHIEKDLGPMALPSLPVSPMPFTIAEYFPTPGRSPFTDTRQHAVSLAYIVPIAGDCGPQEDALEIAWFRVPDLLASDVLLEMEGGHDVIVQRALSHAGVA
ncbi:DUF4916 domain-containing protein [Devriesea agamarum]|uniref:DUF4916 domain-containing protein n=1 Tax=Devriesea agamarum TaxID=472569 RepID=UPI00071E16AC|nr:DUF4916 domain-containing protein [Devriesea agamarum]